MPTGPPMRMPRRSSMFVLCRWPSIRMRLDYTASTMVPGRGAPVQAGLHELEGKIHACPSLFSVRVASWPRWLTPP